MKKIFIPAIFCFISLFCIGKIQAQGLPPGWEYSPTPATHIISIPLYSEPNINGYPLAPGDYIGVFYTDDNGQLACGGAAEWLGDQNTGVIAFGDDSFTPGKDGFASGEPITYKIYSWAVAKEYDAVAECNDSMPSACDVFISNGLSGIISLDATGFYLVAQTSDDSLCAGSSAQLHAIPSGGSGNYTYAWSSDPSGFNSAQQNPMVNPIVSTQYFVEVTDDNSEVLTASVSIEVFDPPVVNAGTDQTICETQSASLNGLVENSESYLWTSSGDGQFSDPQAVSTQYVPGDNDIAAGEVILTLTAQPTDPCTAPVSADLQLDILKLPEVAAGDDQTVCASETVDASASAANAASVLWSTSGDGFFDDPTTANTSYTPGDADLAAGSAVLTITAFPVNPCTTSTEDSFAVGFAPLPEVNLGEDQVICETGTVQLDATGQNYQSLLWTTQGDGVFDDPSALVTVYTPGTQDIQNGSVQLSLSAEAIIPCTQAVENTMTAFITSEPVVFAGEDGTVCEVDDYQLNGFATDYDEVAWTTSGDGSFGDPYALNTFYTPGQEDIGNQQVLLTLTASPEYPCDLSASDEVHLTLFMLPEAYAGEDVTIQKNENVQLNGSASDYVLVLWSSSGDGDFSAHDILDPVYMPGSEDIAVAGATLKLMAFPNSPCMITAEDSLMLTIDTITGLFEPVAANRFKLFPNPAKNEVFVDIPAAAGPDPLQLEMVSMQGEIVYRHSLIAGKRDKERVFRINTSGFIPGVYLVVIKSDKQIYIQKLHLLKE